MLPQHERISRHRAAARGGEGTAGVCTRNGARWSPPPAGSRCSSCPPLPAGMRRARGHTARQRGRNRRIGQNSRVRSGREALVALRGGRLTPATAISPLRSTMAELVCGVSTLPGYLEQGAADEAQAGPAGAVRGAPLGRRPHSVTPPRAPYAPHPRMCEPLGPMWAAETLLQLMVGGGKASLVHAPTHKLLAGAPSRQEPCMAGVWSVEGTQRVLAGAATPATPLRVGGRVRYACTTQYRSLTAGWGQRPRQRLDQGWTQRQQRRQQMQRSPSGPTRSRRRRLGAPGRLRRAVGGRVGRQWGA